MEQIVHVPRDGVRMAVSKALRRVQHNCRARTIPEDWAYQQIKKVMCAQEECALYIDGGAVSYRYISRKFPRRKPLTTKLLVVILNEEVWLKASRGHSTIEGEPRGPSAYYIRVDSALASIDKTAANKWVRNRLAHLVLPASPPLLTGVEPITDNAAVVIDEEDRQFLATKYGYWETNSLFLGNTKTVVKGISRYLGVQVSIAQKIVEGTADVSEIETELTLAKLAK